MATVVVALIFASCSSNKTTTSTLAKDTKPFGKLNCVLKSETGKVSIRFCAGGVFGNPMSPTSIDDRVPSFDGTPLDADLTLPANGSAPYSLIVLLHGLAGSKTDYESNSLVSLNQPIQLNNASLAAHGFAVLDYTARGFGESCGMPSYRTTNCKTGWIHIADQRYEIRDTQYLAGLLVDEGFVKPSIGVSGVSYGGGQSMELSMLKNRVRLQNGKLIPWTSPNGVPMSIGAAFALWGWDDLVNSLAPQGAFNVTNSSANTLKSSSSFGVPKSSWISILVDGCQTGFIAPPGKDPTADILTWQKLTATSLPNNPQLSDLANQFREYKSPVGIPMPAGGPAPITIADGFTDPLFPASEAVEFASDATKAYSNSDVHLILGDFGHSWANNNPNTTKLVRDQGVTFLTNTLEGLKTTERPLTVESVVCPATSQPLGPYMASSFSALIGSSITAQFTSTSSTKSNTSQPSYELTPFNSGFSRTANNNVSNLDSESLLNNSMNDVGSLFGGIEFCDSHPIPTSTPIGTISYLLTQNISAENTKSKNTGVPVIFGSPSITMSYTTTGAFSMIVARVWDVGPTSRQLITQGVSLLPTSTSLKTFTLSLFPTFYKMPSGDRIEISLLGNDSPSFRNFITPFTITVKSLSVSIPTFKSN